MAKIKVEKRDGRLESFDLNKVSNGVIQSGASPEEAEEITSKVEKWIPTIATNGVIKSSEIKTKVLELLQAVNPTAAASFEAYKK